MEDIVLVQKDNVSRSLWPLARAEFNGSARSVKLKLPNSTSVCPNNRICLLEESDKMTIILDFLVEEGVLRKMLCYDENSCCGFKSMGNTFVFCKVHLVRHYYLSLCSEHR